MTGNKANHGGATEIDWSRYEAVVGPGWAYYSPRFRRFARGEWLSWNWAAFFASFAWLRYRKLHAWSWLYLFISAPILLAVAMLFATGGPDACQTALTPNAYLPFQLLGLGWAALDWIVLPLFANRLYFQHVRRLVDKAGQPAASPGVARAAPAIVLVLQAGFLLAAVATTAQYANYVYRSRVSEAFSLTDGLKAGIEEYFRTHGRFPTRTAEVTEPVSGQYVSQVVVEPAGRIRATFGKRAQRLVGRSVVIVPVVEGGTIRWTCGSPDLPDVCLPSSCRGREIR